MPIYEYRCEACGHYLDALQKLTDEPLKECPECAGNLRRLISKPSFRLKGGGWYETDFKSDKERKRNVVGDGEKSDSKTAASDKAEKSADSKSAEGKSSSKESSGPSKSPSGTEAA